MIAKYHNRVHYAIQRGQEFRRRGNLSVHQSAYQSSGDVPTTFIAPFIICIVDYIVDARF